MFQLKYGQNVYKEAAGRFSIDSVFFNMYIVTPELRRDISIAGWIPWEQVVQLSAWTLASAS